MEKISIILMVLLLLGCGATANNNSSYYSPAYEPRVDWPVDEYAIFDQADKINTIRGQAFLKTRGGDVITAAGNMVILNPVTTYSTQFVDAIILGKHGRGVLLTPRDPDPRIKSYMYEAVADAQGKFTFYDIPNGEFYLYTQVTWKALNQYGKAVTQGGWVFKKINILDNKRNEFILSGIDRF